MTSTSNTIRVKAVLLDIEGTTTPVDFVYKVLFPFAKERLEQYLARHRDEVEVYTLIDELSKEREEEQDNDAPEWDYSDPAFSALAYLKWLMANDRKSTTLKAIQGRIWVEGYKTGELKGEMFADVVPALKAWHEQGISINIFSSGSILAQQLIFGHSTEGDLRPMIDHYFDTTTGPKRNVSSYRRISSKIGELASDILFISDVPQELEAAGAAGFQTRQSVRPGNPAPHDGNFVAIQRFDEVSLEMKS